jgi:hypothetical protein
VGLRVDQPVEGGGERGGERLWPGRIEQVLVAGLERVRAHPVREPVKDLSDELEVPLVMRLVRDGRGNAEVQGEAGPYLPAEEVAGPGAEVGHDGGSWLMMPMTIPKIASLRKGAANPRDTPT